MPFMQPATILLVDDDDAIREVIRALLEMRGYQVIDVEEIGRAHV